MRRILTVTLLVAGLLALTAGGALAGKAKGSGIEILGWRSDLTTADPAVPGNCLLTFYWQPNAAAVYDHFEYVTGGATEPKSLRKLPTTSTTALGFTASVPAGTGFGWAVRIVQPDGTVRSWSPWFGNLAYTC